MMVNSSDVNKLLLFWRNGLFKKKLRKRWNSVLKIHAFEIMCATDDLLAFRHNGIKVNS